MGYFKNQQIELDDGRLYQPLTDDETVAYAKWASKNEDEMYQRYLNLEPRVREQHSFWDYLQLMWENHINFPA